MLKFIEVKLFHNVQEDDWMPVMKCEGYERLIIKHSNFRKDWTSEKNSAIKEEKNSLFSWILRVLFCIPSSHGHLYPTSPIPSHTYTHNHLTYPTPKYRFHQPFNFPIASHQPSNFSLVIALPLPLSYHVSFHLLLQSNLVLNLFFKPLIF